MEKQQLRFVIFLIALSFLTSVLFWQIFLKNKIPFSANLLASFFNPWAQENFPGWEVGIPNKPTGKDDLWIFYPQRTFTNSLLKNGEIPFWNPYSFSGNYHVGLSETAVFYPLNFLFLLFSQINVWIFLIVIEPIIAGVGMFLYLQRVTIHKKSAVLGAFAFAFCGIVLVRSVEGLSVGHTLIWMPYVFWGIEAFFQTSKTRYLCVILFSLSFSLLAGWIQYTFYIVVFSFLYCLFMLCFNAKKKSKMYLLIALPFILFPLITLFHILPAFQTLLDSPRVGLSGSVFSRNHLVPLTHIFTLIFPDFWGNPAVFNYIGKSDFKDSVLFIGVIPFLFSLFALSTRQNKKVIFFTASIGITFLLATDNVISQAILSSHIPIFSTFLPNRIFLITTFSFCILAAFGFDLLLNEKKNIYGKLVRNTFIFVWVLIGILVAFILFRVLKDPGVLQRLEGGINRNIEAIQLRTSLIPIFLLFVTTIICILFRNNYSKNIFFFFIVLILFSQSFLFGQKYFPFSNREFLYPPHPVFTYLTKHQGFDRFMSIGYGHIVPSIPLQFNLYSPEGIGSMYLQRYGEFISYMKNEDITFPDKIAFDQEIYPKDVFYPKNPRLHRFYELSSVKHIVVDKKSMAQSMATPNRNDFFKIWENDTWLMYQYKKSMPRFFVTSNFKVVNNDKEILQALFSKVFFPNQIILEESPGFTSSESMGSTEIVTYTPNRIVAKVTSKNQALFYISDNYAKQFRVFIDGKEEKILRANYTFRAVPIPKGEHTVVMVYDDRAFVLGLRIAFLFVSMICITMIIFRKYA